ARVLVGAAGRILPGQLEQRSVSWVLGACQPVANSTSEVVYEPELGAPVALWLERLEVPLQETLRVREGPVLLDVCSSRHQEDLGADRLRLELAGFELRRVVPEGGALDLVEVAHDEPVQACQREPLQLRVRG